MSQSGKLTCAAAIAASLAIANTVNAQSIWNLAEDGNWNVAENWNPQGVPNDPTVDVIIDGDGNVHVVVLLNMNASVRDLTIDVGDTLSIENGRRLSIFGDLFNDGLLLVNPSNSATYLQVVGDVTFSGSGVVELGSGLANLYDASDVNAGPDHLTNSAGHTIRGFGNIGNADRLQITNEGLILANIDGQTLTITPNSGGMINTGTLRASDGGNLEITGASLSGTFIDNTGGIIDAQADSTVSYNTLAHIAGGELVGDGTHHIIASAPARFEDLTNSSVVQIDNSRRLDLVGAIVNNGAIRFDSISSATYLQTVGEVNLTGTGVLEMNNTNLARLYDLTDSNGGADHLIHGADHTIRGAGQIGSADRLQITNHGLILANVDGQTLTITPNSGGMINSGTLRASDGGNLEITGASLSGAFIDNTGGIIDAQTDSTVSYNTLAYIVGGELVGDGTHHIIASNPARFEDLTNSSMVQIDNSRRLDLVGAIVNNGTIQFASISGTTYLQTVGEVNLTGTGVVEMNNTNLARLYDLTDSNGAADHLIHGADHTIRGAGQIGNADRLQITNHGLIVADIDGQSLTITPNSGGMVNDGTLRATGGGNLVLNGTSLDEAAFTNTNGTIDAQTDSTVTYDNAAHIVGGELVGAGTHRIVASTPARFENLTNSSFVDIDNARRLDLVGAIVNDGTILVDSLSGNTYLQSVGTVTLAGTGAVQLVNNLAWFYDGTDSNDAPDHLINSATHTIHGAGNIGYQNNLQITNHGLIEADVDGAVLNITPNDQGMVNFGTLRASNGGELRIWGGALGNASINNTGAIIEAAKNSTVSYDAQAHIVGGELVGEGTHRILSSSPARFENLTNSSFVVIDNSRRLDLVGTIVNDGTILVDSSSGNTYLQPVGTVTLAGTGTVQLLNHLAWFYDRTDSNDAPDHLINSAGHTIHGAGHLGYQSHLQITNHGLIHADVEGGTLEVNPNASGLNNIGTLRASGGGTLTIETGYGSLINLDNVILNGGAYEVMANSTMRLGGVVDTNNAAILLDGVDSNLYSTASNDALANFAVNQGSFTITNGRDFTAAGSFANSGVLHVGAASTFSLNAEETLTNTGTLAGFGAIAGNVVTSGLLSPGNSIGTLTIDGDLTVASGASYDWHVDALGSDLIDIVNGDLIFEGGLLTLNVLLGNGGLPVDGMDHVLMNVADGQISYLGAPDVAINLPTGWTSDGLLITDNQVLLTNVTIPEPASMVLVIAGAALCFTRRRRA